MITVSWSGLVVVGSLSRHKYQTTLAPMLDDDPTWIDGIWSG
jgi:hypothetical protein